VSSSKPNWPDGGPPISWTNGGTPPPENGTEKEEKIMYNNFADYYLNSLASEFIKDVNWNRQIESIATSFVRWNDSASFISIFKGLNITSDEPEEDINIHNDADFDLTQIKTKIHHVQDFLPYARCWHLVPNYENLLGQTSIPHAACEIMDRELIDTLNGQNDLSAVDYDEDPMALLAGIKKLMDSDEKCIPTEDRFLVLPAEAEVDFSRIFGDKLYEILGMRFVFFNNPGLKNVAVDGGTNLLWTCYAVSKHSVGEVVGYGEELNGKPLTVVDSPNGCGICIRTTFAYGAKVLNPKGVVRFNVKTKNHSAKS
jgi:hypothetical protein